MINPKVNPFIASSGTLQHFWIAPPNPLELTAKFQHVTSTPKKLHITIVLGVGFASRQIERSPQVSGLLSCPILYHSPLQCHHRHQ